MKITKPNITEGEWVHEFTKVESDDYCICECESDSINKSVANAKAISAVPNMIDELISDYEAFEWMYEHANETAIADYCHDKMESIKQTLIKLGCTYEP